MNYSLAACWSVEKTKERETPREKEEETGKVAIYFSEIAAYYRTCCEVQITAKKIEQYILSVIGTISMLPCLHLYCTFLVRFRGFGIAMVRLLVSAT